LLSLALLLCGGGNFKLKKGSHEGWFINHKAENLFYTSWTNQSVCPVFPDTAVSRPPPCKSLAEDLISTCDGFFYVSGLSKERLFR
jgi:hypothetical protein